LAKEHDQGREEHQRPTYQKMMTAITMINNTMQTPPHKESQLG